VMNVDLARAVFIFFVLRPIKIMQKNGIGRMEDLFQTPPPQPFYTVTVKESPVPTAGSSWDHCRPGVGWRECNGGCLQCTHHCQCKCICVDRTRRGHHHIGRNNQKHRRKLWPTAGTGVVRVSRSTSVLQLPASIPLCS